MKCKACGSPIHGRSDKQFCDNDCRNKYHNQNKSTEEKYIIAINKILRRNRAILRMLNPEGKTTVRRALLEKEKFDFRFYTHIFKSSSYLEYRFCYEYGYAVVPKDKILIVIWQENMKADILREPDMEYNQVIRDQ